MRFLTLRLAWVLPLFFSIQLQSQEDQLQKTADQLVAMGDSLLTSNERSSKSRMLYREAIEINPDHALAYHRLGRSYLADYFNFDGPAENLDSAIIYEHKARIIDPGYISAYWNEVLGYRLRWRHGMSRKVLIEALEHNPDDPSILTLMGRNYFDTGNPGLALPYLEKAIQIGGEDAPGIAYRFAGWCWFYYQDHNKQLEYFNRFREIDPKSLMGIAGQVHSYTGLKQYEKATELAKQIKADNPDHENPAFLEAYIAETLLFGGKIDDAITFYEKSQELDPQASNLFATRAVTTTLGYLYMKTGKESEGQELLDRTIERRMKDWLDMPERWEFAFDIASAYAAKDDLDNAYQWLYTSVLTGYPGHLWYDDPIFEHCHEVRSFQELVKQARIRVIAEFEERN